MRLEGKVAIVTGGARGIGREYALGLAREGAKVVIADIDQIGAQEAAKEIVGSGGEALALHMDVTVEKSTLEMAKNVAEKFGRIDALVNNAAVYHGLSYQPVDLTAVEEWERVLAVNLKGPFLCVRAVLPWMKAQRYGKIINIASGTVWRGAINLSHYTTSKAGIIGFTRALARELGPYNISVNSLAPGLTDTEASRSFIPDIAQDRVAQERCFKRREYGEDLVGTLVFLVSSDSDFITGQTVNVDGGANMW